MNECSWNNFSRIFYPDFKNRRQKFKNGIGCHFSDYKEFFFIFLII